MQENNIAYDIQRAGHNAVDHLVEQAESFGDDFLRVVYLFVSDGIDYIMDKRGLRDAAACGEGCHWCCGSFMNIAVHSSELDLITSSVEVPKVRGSWCPFLDLKTKNCTIYPVRPLSCRCYYSTSLFECKKCYRSKGKSTVYFNIQSKILEGVVAAAIMRISGDYNVYHFYPTLKSYNKTGSYGTPWKTLTEADVLRDEG